MKITSIVAGVVAGITLALTGCGGVAEPEQAPGSDPAAVEEQASSQDVTQMAICPLRWTCFDGNYHSTQAQCTASCGGAPCERDYACTGRCVCP